MTNLLTAFLLLSTTLLLGQSWIDESSGYLPLIGSILSLTACAALVIETLLADEKSLVKRIRRRARPIQYAILLWIWVLWFGNRAEWFDLSPVSLLIDIVQTIASLFVLLELAHRIQLGRMQIQMDWNPLGMMKEAYHSMKLLLSESQLAVMRSTSTQVMKSLQLMTELFTLVILGLVILGIVNWSDSIWFDEITLRLFSIYALQISARAYVFSKK